MLPSSPCSQSPPLRLRSVQRQTLLPRSKRVHVNHRSGAAPLFAEHRLRWGAGSSEAGFCWQLQGGCRGAGCGFTVLLKIQKLELEFPQCTEVVGPLPSDAPVGGSAHRPWQPRAGQSSSCADTEQQRSGWRAQSMPGACEYALMHQAASKRLSKAALPPVVWSSPAQGHL